MCIYHILFIYLLAMVNTAAVNISVQASEFCLWYIPRGGIAGSCGNSLFNFSNPKTFTQHLYHLAFPLVMHENFSSSTS